MLHGSCILRLSQSSTHCFALSIPSQRAMALLGGVAPPARHLYRVEGIFEVTKTGLDQHNIGTCEIVVDETNKWKCCLNVPGVGQGDVFIYSSMITSPAQTRGENRILLPAARAAHGASGSAVRPRPCLSATPLYDDVLVRLAERAESAWRRDGYDHGPEYPAGKGNPRGKRSRAMSFPDEGKDNHGKGEHARGKGHYGKAEYGKAWKGHCGRTSPY